MQQCYFISRSNTLFKAKNVFIEIFEITNNNLKIQRYSWIYKNSLNVSNFKDEASTASMDRTPLIYRMYIFNEYKYVNLFVIFCLFASSRGQLLWFHLMNRHNSATLNKTFSIKFWSSVPWDILPFCSGKRKYLKDRLSNRW